MSFFTKKAAEEHHAWVEEIRRKVSESETTLKEGTAVCEDLLVKVVEDRLAGPRPGTQTFKPVYDASGNVIEYVSGLFIPDEEP